MNRLRCVVIAWCVMLSCGVLPAAAQEPGGIRAWGMGQAFTAVPGDVDATYANPAGLAAVEDPELNVNFGSAYGAAGTGHLGGALMALPLGNRLVSGAHLSSADGFGSDLQQAGVTLAGKWYPGISSRPFRLGATAKWRSDASNTQFVLMDAGLQQDVIRGTTGGGISVRNLFSGDLPGAPIVPSFGWYYRDAMWGLASADLSYQSGRAYASLGVEKSFYRGLMVVRAGYAGSVRPFLTTGLSCSLWPVGFDTSFAWPTEDKRAGYYQFAFRYRFGGGDFSEVYLNKATERSIVLERRIRRLEARYREMAEGAGQTAVWTAADDGQPDGGAPPSPHREAAVTVSERKESPAAPGKKPETPAAPEEAVSAQARKAPAAEPVRRPEPRVAPVSWPQRHRVVQGDTLRGLAKRYYQDSNKWQSIYKVNQDKMDRGQPLIGAELTIPEP